MKKTIATIATAAAVCLTVPGTVSADYGIDSPEYRDMRICYIPLDGGQDWGQVVDTFYLLDSMYGVPNVGTTSGAGPVPCLPTACPPGYTLVSTACLSYDPFEQIPFDTEPAESFSPSQDVSDDASEPDLTLLPLGVGPLVEPAIATVS